MSTEQSIDQMEIIIEWDRTNTGLLADKLFRHVENGDFKFELSAEPGSILTTIAVGMGVGLAADFVYDLSKYLLLRYQGSELSSPTVIVKVNGETYQTDIETQADIQNLKTQIGSVSQEFNREDEDDDEDLDAASAFGG